MAETGSDGGGEGVDMTDVNTELNANTRGKSILKRKKSTVANINIMCRTCLLFSMITSCVH